MHILPIKTPRLTKGDNIVETIYQTVNLADGDIVVISSKAVACIEGRIFKEPFEDAIQNECKRMNGEAVRKTPEVTLTKLKPDGMDGDLLVAFAGLDQSNCEEGSCIGWPEDPAKSVKMIFDEFQEKTGLHIPVILSDSSCKKGRRGVTAIGLTYCGLEPIVSRKGEKDLYNRELHLTEEAVVDQLATAANAVMGSAAESIPAVVIRGYNYNKSDAYGWVPGIAAEEDMFG